MKPTKFLILSTCLLCFFNQCQAQFYPDSNAVWCIGDGELAGGDIPNEQMEMSAETDTIISGMAYKRISEYHSLMGVWYYATRHYVRSSPDGKGYVYLPDSMSEYLTGDTAALAGDTVHDVLIKSSIIDCGLDFELADVIVDSVVVITLNSVSVRRQYIHTMCYSPSSPEFDGTFFFWQTRMGTSCGPYLQIRQLLAPIHMGCAVIDGSYVYNVFTIPIGMPGTTCDCSALSVGLSEPWDQVRGGVHPNPSTGLFTVEEHMRSATIYDATGRLLFEASGPQIDLSAYPPGLYHAVVRTAQGIGHVRLMVQR